MLSNLSEEQIKKLSSIPKNTFWDYVGAEITFISNEHANCTLDIKEHHLNMVGILHGGVHATLIDSAMGLLATLQKPGKETVTIQLSINYFAAVKEGKVTVETSVVQSSRSLVTTEGIVYDEHGKMLAKGQAVFKVIDRGVV